MGPKHILIHTYAYGLRVTSAVDLSFCPCDVWCGLWLLVFHLQASMPTTGVEKAKGTGVDPQPH